MSTKIRLSMKKATFLERLPGVRKMTESEKQAGWQRDYNLRRSKVDGELSKLYGIGAVVTELESKISTAESHANGSRFQQAFEALGGYEVLVKNATKRAEAAATEEGRNAIFKIRFENKVKRLEKSLATLVDFPGAVHVVEGLKAKIKLAQVDAGNEAYEAAYLKMAGLTKEEKAARKLGGKAEKGLKSPVKEQYEAAKTNLQAASNFLAAATTKERRAELFKILQVALDNPRDTPKLTTTADKLRALASQLGTIVRVGTELVGQINPLKTACESNLRLINEAAPLETSVPVSLALDKATAMLARRDYEDSLTAFTELKTTSEATRKEVVKAKQAWVLLAKSLPKTVDKALAELKDVPATRESALALVDELADVRGSVDTKRNWTEATAAVKALGVEVMRLRTEVVRPYLDPALAKARTDAEIAVGPSIGMYETWKETLAEAMKAAGGTGASIGKFQVAFDKLKADWKKGLDTSLAKADLTKAKQALLDGLEELRKEMDAASKDTAQIDGLVVDEKQAELQGQLDELTPQAQRLIEELAALGGPSYDTLSADLRTALTKAKKGDLAGGVAGLELVITAATNAKRTQGAALEQKKRDAALALENVKKAAVKQKKKGDSLFAEFYDDLIGDIDDLLALVKAGNLDGIEGAQKNALALTARLEKLELEKNTADDPTVPSFKRVLLRLKQLTARLKQKVLRVNLPGELATLSERFKDVSGEVGTLDPEKGLALVEALSVDIEAAIVTANGRKAHRARIKVLGNTLKKAIKEAGITSDSALAVKLEGQIKGALAGARTDGGETDAQATLDDVKTKIEAIKNATTPTEKQGLIRKGEKEAVDENRTASEARAGWKTRYDNYQNLVTRLRKLVKADPEADMSQVEDMARMGKQAATVAKSGEYVGATQLLEQGEALAKQIEENPQGFKKTARDNLGGMDARWKSAVLKFIEARKKMTAAITTWCDEQTPPDPRKSNVPQLEALDANFKLDAFKKPIALLADPTSDRNARKAAREGALRNVRRYIAILTKDPLIKIAIDRKNPFGSLMGPCHNLLTILEDLNFNMRVCV